MLLRNSRTYHSDLCDMEDKLDLILKGIQDLKLRVDGLESKSKEETLENRETRRENRNDRRRDESTIRLRINEDDIIRKIKINPPTFDGILDPKFFSDWMTDLDYYLIGIMVHSRGLGRRLGGH